MMVTIARAVATIEAPSRPRHGRMTTSAATFVEHIHDEQQLSKGTLMAPSTGLHTPLVPAAASLSCVVLLRMK